MNALPTGEQLSELAIAEFKAREKRAADMVKDRRLTATRAEMELRPWASLALRFAHDPAALIESSCLSPTMEEWQVLGGTRGDGSRFCSPRSAAIILADDICLRRDVVATLTRVRDDALDRHAGTVSGELATRLRRIVTLAIAMGCPPYTAAKENDHAIAA